MLMFMLVLMLMSQWKPGYILKNTARIEIIITASVENCTNCCANCCANCYYNFNPCGIFENMTSFTPILNEVLERGKLMAALNSRK